MRYMRWFLVGLWMLLLLSNGVLEALAMNTGFSTEALPEDDINTVLKNVNISMLTREPQKKSIDCFDVNEDGLIAIGSSDSENKTVCIYTDEGDFQYGYRFKTNGSFGIELDNDILMVYLVRSDIAIAVNSMGDVESVLKIQNTSENNSYWYNFVYLTRRSIGDKEYMIKNDMGFFNIFASSYAQLIVKNTDGEECVIYDVGAEQLLNMVVTFVVVVVFSCFAVAVIIWQFIKLRHETEKYPC